MTGGCIPVVTNIGSLPEVVADAGIYLPSNDPLAIARGIVEGHHGRIWAENAPQGGALVGFELPYDS